MTKEDLKDALWDQDFYASLSQGYEHELATWQGWTDMGLKMAVGVFAVWSLILSLDAQNGRWAVGVSLTSVLIAIALNIIPISSWRAQHLVAYHQWTKLRKDVQSIQVAEFGQKFDGQFMLESKGRFASEDESKALNDLLVEFSSRSHQIELEEETSTITWFMQRAERRERQRRWGVPSQKDVQAKIDNYRPTSHQQAIAT